MCPYKVMLFAMFGPRSRRGGRWAIFAFNFVGNRLLSGAGGSGGRTQNARGKPSHQHISASSINEVRGRYQTKK